MAQKLLSDAGEGFLTGEDEQSNIQTLNQAIDSSLLMLEFVEYARLK